MPMRTTRLTILALFSVLLMHTGGVLLSLHQSAHHADRAPAAHTCEGGSHDRQPSDAPQPIEHKDCSICLGLAGLQLITAPEPPRAVAAPAFTEPERAVALATPALRVQRDRPARAPPVR